MGDLLQRFHQVLVEEIRAKRPEYLSGPFTVAEIYQNLVPYGTHRDRLGVDMNGDYEDALLRMLAGEGGYLTLESEHALSQLREELETSNPNTGLYRDFAAVDVRLSHRRAGAPPRAAAKGGDAPPRTGQDADEAEHGAWGEEWEEAVSISDLAPAEAGQPSPQAEAPADQRHHTDPALAEYHEPASPVAPVMGHGLETHGGAEVEGMDTCPWCRAALPSRSNLNFCPFCGTDVHVVPCPGCGEELEPDWRFCISCGTEVAG
jgi:hypothetical protein